MFFILVIALTGYSVVTISKEMVQAAGTGAWIPVIITSLVFALTGMVIVSLNNMFKGKTLIEYAPALITKPGMYIVAFFYLFYFLFILVYLVNQFAELLKIDFFLNTPLWVFPAAAIPVCCYIAYKGITNVARLAEIFGVVYFITGNLVHIVMTLEGKVNRLLPLFNAEEIGNYLSGLQYSILPFLGVEILLMIPLTAKNGKKAKKTIFWTVIVIGLFYVFIVESCDHEAGALRHR